jgi:hypothetical protein
MPWDDLAPRPARALGRGLEDVSDLFLPGTNAPDSPRVPVEDPPSPPAARPSVRAGIGVIRRGGSLTKNQLVSTLLEYPDALEPGLQTLGGALPCGPSGVIDVLALDRLNRIVVIDVDTTLVDQLLLRGMSHLDWASRHIAILLRLHPRATIDGAQAPRLVLVAPRFSETLMSAVSQLTRGSVTLFRYHAVAINGGTGVLFEPLGDERDAAESVP